MTFLTRLLSRPHSQSRPHRRPTVPGRSPRPENDECSPMPTSSGWRPAATRLAPQIATRTSHPTRSAPRPAADGRADRSEDANDGNARAHALEADWRARWRSVDQKVATTAAGGARTCARRRRRRRAIRRSSPRAAARLRCSSAGPKPRGRGRGTEDEFQDQGPPRGRPARLAASRVRTTSGGPSVTLARFMKRVRVAAGRAPYDVWHR